MTMTETTLVREVQIAAAPATVYKLLTDPALIVRWFGHEAALDPRPGGVFRVGINDVAAAEGTYVELIENERVVFTFGWAGAAFGVTPGSSTVTVDLVAAAGGTRVRLTHSDLPAEAVAEHDHGWGLYLDRLVILGQGGDPGPDPNADPAAMA